MAAESAPMARRTGVRPVYRFRRLGMVLGIAALVGVALIGAAHPISASGGTSQIPAAATAAPAATGASVWDANATGGLDPMDVITKGALVLILLFITLRVLGRMQAANPKKLGRLVVMESRPLASKASLHLVAVGQRRLVVGLTPSGMVSLAELDASEFKETEDALEAETAAARVAANAAPPTMAGTVIAAALAPIDALAGRLATFFSGGRAR